MTSHTSQLNYFLFFCEEGNQVVVFKSNQVSEIINRKSKLESSLIDTGFKASQDELSLAQKSNSLDKQIQTKRSHSRIDYNFFNYCSICELKYPKQVLRCKDCNQKVRTRPWHRSKIIDRKRI